MKKKLSLLLVAAMLFSVLVLPAQAAKPGDEISITIPFSHANPLFSIKVSYTLSAGLTYLSASSAEMSMTGSKTAAIGISMAGVKTGNVTLKVKVNEGAAAKETVNITSVEGAWDGNPGDKGTVGSAGVHAITVDVPAADEWEAWVTTKEATCTEAGSRTRKHKTDPALDQTEVIPALGHDYGEWLNSFTPTCEFEGTEIRFCNRDIMHPREERIVPALGHDWNEWKVTVAATCLTDGARERVCKRKATHIETEVIKALGHDWGEWKVTVAATCLTDGVRERVCTRDATHKETEVIKALGHDAGKWVITKKPTRTEEGARELRCTRDGAVLKTEVLPMITVIEYPNNTMCIMGLRLRDIAPDATSKWYMVTPVDIAQDGEQTFPLVASNIYRVGPAPVAVKEGQLTVTCSTLNGVTVHNDYLAIYPDLDTAVAQDAASLGGESFKLGEPISIADKLSGDTSVLLLLCSTVTYDTDVKGLSVFRPGAEDVKDALEQMGQMIP